MKTILLVLLVLFTQCTKTKLYKFGNYEIKYLGTYNADKTTFTLDPAVKWGIETIVPASSYCVSPQGIVVSSKRKKIRKMNRFMRSIKTDD